VSSAALYARVSTADKGQDTANQIPEFTRYCQQHQKTPLIYTEQETGTGRKSRPVFEKVLRDAEFHKFDVLVVWALDRLTREGPLRAMLTLNRLQLAGVKVKSLTEPWLDPDSPLYELLVPILAWIAKQEAKRMSERVHAGLDRARASGRRLGRPVTVVNADLVRRRRAQGLSWREIGRELKVSPMTCRKALKGETKRIKNPAKKRPVTY
jgi:DNA invertase Pin-like site-specific DNA recombinase